MSMYSERELQKKHPPKQTTKIDLARERPLNKPYALWLQWMVKRAGSGFPDVHYADFERNDFENESEYKTCWASRGDYAKLEKWGLIVRSINPATGRWLQGHYRVTPLAKDFVGGAVKMPASLVIQQNKVVETNPHNITLKQALKIKSEFSERTAV